MSSFIEGSKFEPDASESTTRSRHQSDICRHCRHTFQEHYNDQCPKNEIDEAMPEWDTYKRAYSAD